MKCVVLSQYKKTAKNAGPKAKTDIERILSKEYGFSIATFPLEEGKISKVNKIIRVVKKIVFTRKVVKGYDKVIVQAPYSEKSIIMSSIKEPIVIIHDIEGLRTNNEQQLNSEINFYKKSSMIIAHNNKMKNFLIKQGISDNKIITIDVFDYITSDSLTKVNRKRKKEKTIAYTGNIDKADFIFELEEKKLDYNINLYGVLNKKLNNKKINYKGAFSPEELINNIDADLGLVWDGKLDNSDENVGLKNYTKYNNPHKLSCYIAAGIPVIVWDKSAVADFVEENNIGYVISSLYDINKIDFKDYDIKEKNVLRIREKIIKGYYTKRAIEKCLKVIEKKNN